MGLEGSTVEEFSPSPKLVRIYWVYGLWYFIPAVIAYPLIAVANPLLSAALLVVLIGVRVLYNLGIRG